MNDEDIRHELLSSYKIQVYDWMDNEISNLEKSYNPEGSDDFVDYFKSLSPHTIKNIAKSCKVKGYYDMNKATLVKILTSDLHQKCAIAKYKEFKESQNIDKINLYKSLTLKKLKDLTNNCNIKIRSNIKTKTDLIDLLISQQDFGTPEQKKCINSGFKDLLGEDYKNLVNVPSHQFKVNEIKKGDVGVFRSAGFYYKFAVTDVSNDGKIINTTLDIKFSWKPKFGQWNRLRKARTTFNEKIIFK